MDYSAKQLTLEPKDRVRLATGEEYGFALVLHGLLRAGGKWLLGADDLLVFRQRGIGRTMIRVGAARRNVHTYFLFCAGTVALPAAGLGLILSRFVCLGVLKLLEVVLDGATSLDLYYSNTALAMHRSATEYLAAPGWGALAVIALGTLALALLSCLVFSVVSLERRHKMRRRESRAAQGTPSRPLRGGPRTYARLSRLLLMLVPVPVEASRPEKSSVHSLVQAVSGLASTQRV